MRSVWVSASFLLACSGDPDRTMFDAGSVDAVVNLDCSSCTATQYCRVRPNGPCSPQDGGVCASPATEACENNSLQGCTPPQTRECVELPAMCQANPGCACLISTNPCPGSIHADCRNLTIECPFP